MLATATIADEILDLKRERRAILLAHHYQEPEIQALADVVGDSLELARKARDFEGDVISFAGVWFMAETAKALNPHRTVVVPDGGMVLMGGLKQLSEERSEYGPPILSKIPYVNRLFKNVGYGRSTDSLLIMVTPRIIIQEEEEQRATGFTNQPLPGAQ